MSPKKTTSIHVSCLPASALPSPSPPGTTPRQHQAERRKRKHHDPGAEHRELVAGSDEPRHGGAGDNQKGQGRRDEQVAEPVPRSPGPCRGKPCAGMLMINTRAEHERAQGQDAEQRQSRDAPREQDPVRRKTLRIDEVDESGDGPADGGEKHLQVVFHRPVVPRLAYNLGRLDGGLPYTSHQKSHERSGNHDEGHWTREQKEERAQDQGGAPSRCLIPRGNDPADNNYDLDRAHPSGVLEEGATIRIAPPSPPRSPSLAGRHRKAPGP